MASTPLDIELAEPHRIYVQQVWRRFSENGCWPAAVNIENALRRQLPPKTNVYDVLRTIPSVIGWAQMGSDQAARITPIALAIVVPDEAAEVLGDFFRGFQICRERYNAAPDDSHVRLCSGDLGELTYDTIRIRRTNVLLRDRNLLHYVTGGLDVDDGVQYEWDLEIYIPVINLYRDVENFEEYLVTLREEINGMSGSPGFVPEGLPIEPIRPVRFQAGVPNPAPHGDVHVHIEGSTVGSFLWGSTVNTIESNLTISKGISGEELANALHTLTEACATDQALDDEQRQQALQIIEYISDVATKPPEQRSVGVLRSAVNGLASIMAVAAEANQIWQQWAPIILQGLHLSGH